MGFTVRYLKKRFGRNVDNAYFFAKGGMVDGPRLDGLMIDLLNDLAGIEALPEESRQKVWDMAYERGHSAGYGAILSELEDLVGLFPATNIPTNS